MWTRQCLQTCAIIVLLINLHEISANDNTHYLPPLECYDPYGRPQVSKISDFFSFLRSFYFVCISQATARNWSSLHLSSTRFKHQFSIFFHLKWLRDEKVKMCHSRWSLELHIPFECERYISKSNQSNDYYIRFSVGRWTLSATYNSWIVDS